MWLFREKMCRDSSSEDVSRWCVGTLTQILLRMLPFATFCRSKGCYLPGEVEMWKIGLADVVGNLFCCSLFLGLKGSFTYLFVWRKKWWKMHLFQMHWLVPEPWCGSGFAHQPEAGIVGFLQLKSKSKRILDLVETKFRCWQTHTMLCLNSHLANFFEKIRWIPNSMASKHTVKHLLEVSTFGKLEIVF